MQAVDKEVEDLVGEKLPGDYLSNLELGAFVKQHETTFRRCFADTFGGGFGASLFELAGSMLSVTPEARPGAESVLAELKKSTSQS